jgi:mannose-6-phosphate isomerase-like protein (cupin superfamily)
MPRPEPLWFIDNLARVHVDGEGTSGRLAIVEITGRAGEMPPLHVHHTADETFFVLEGSISLHLPGQRVDLGEGSSFWAPLGIPHVYRVESPVARWLAVCAPAGFDAFVREVSEPAATDELPPHGREHDLAAISSAAARHGIELLGPPGTFP